MWCTVYIVEVCVGAVLPLGEGWATRGDSQHHQPSCQHPPMTSPTHSSCGTQFIVWKCARGLSSPPHTVHVAHSSLYRSVHGGRPPLRGWRSHMKVGSKHRSCGAQFMSWECARGPSSPQHTVHVAHSSWYGGVHEDCPPPHTIHVGHNYCIEVYTRGPPSPPHILRVAHISWNGSVHRQPLRTSGRLWEPLAASGSL